MKKLTLPDSPGFNLLAGLASLLLLSLLIVFVARGKAQDISSELRQKTNLALKDRGFTGVTAQVDGRDVVLTGQTTLESTRIQAGDAVTRIAGVANIANRIEVSHAERQRRPVNSRPAPPVLSPRPPVPRPNLNDVPLSAAFPPGNPNTTQPEPGPVTPAPVTPRPAVPKPVTPTAVTPRPISAAPRVAIAPPVAARPVQPTPVPQSGVVAVPAPAPLASAPVVKPVAPVIPPVVPVPARPTPKPAAPSRLQTATATPKPYILQLALEGGGIKASGYLPDDAALQVLEQRVKLNQPLTLKQADAPPQFVKAVEFAAQAADQLSRGKVRIADRQISIEGWADGAVDEFIQKLQPALPAGYTFTVQVSSNQVAAPAQPATAATIPVRESQVAIAEAVPVDVVNDQQFVREALACQADIDSVMRGKTVEFKFASDALETRSEQFLQQIATAMNRCPSAYLYVIGHTDSVGTQERNQRLSQRRAGSVADYLVSQGVYSEFVIAEGRGEKEPIFSNNTDDGRARNRRIEFSVRSEPSL